MTPNILLISLQAVTARRGNLPINEGLYRHGATATL